LFALTACNSGTPAGTSGGGEEGGDAAAEKPYEVATEVSLEGSPTYDRVVEADQVTIGVKEDQPGLGYYDATSGTRSGFDVEIARWMAASLGFDEDKIDWQAVPSANREQALVNGDIDFYVGTYSITDER